MAALNTSIGTLKSFLMLNETKVKSIEARQMEAEPNGSEMIGLCHVGLCARNPAALAEFYRDVMGMQLVGGSDASHPLGPTAFLSSRPGEESHEIAIFSNPALAHRAFKVRSLAALKRFYDKITERGIPIKFQFNHGVSIAFYFQDPEGNLIEVYWRTAVEHPQGMMFLSPPCAQETDLTKTEEELLEELSLLTHRMGIESVDEPQLAAGSAN
jgi:catechol 2,3-dioxygenase-like lactoylglutathione lyase family enzyme